MLFYDDNNGSQAIDIIIKVRIQQQGSSGQRMSGSRKIQQTKIVEQQQEYIGENGLYNQTQSQQSNENDQNIQNENEMNSNNLHKKKKKRMKLKLKPKHPPSFYEQLKAKKQNLKKQKQWDNRFTLAPIISHTHTKIKLPLKKERASTRQKSLEKLDSHKMKVTKHETMYEARQRNGKSFNIRIMARKEQQAQKAYGEKAYGKIQQRKIFEEEQEQQIGSSRNEAQKVHKHKYIKTEAKQRDKQKSNNRGLLIMNGEQGTQGNVLQSKRKGESKKRQAFKEKLEKITGKAKDTQKQNGKLEAQNNEQQAKSIENQLMIMRNYLTEEVNKCFIINPKSCQRDVLLQIINNSKEKLLRSFILGELSRFQNKKTTYNRIEELVQKRMGLIDLFKQQAHITNENIRKYRLTTLRIIEQVLKWKEEWQNTYYQMTKKRTQLNYFLDGEVYMLKLEKGAQLKIGQSMVGFEGDPFLLGLKREGMQPISNEILIKIRACEMLFLQYKMKR